MIKISLRYPNSLSNPDTTIVELPSIPRVGEIVLDYGCHEYTVLKVAYQPFPREIDSPPMVELTLQEVR